MNKTPELDQFVKDSIQAGKTEESIRSVLSEAGWDNKRVTNVLEQYYFSDYPVAVPRPKAFASPRLFFLNLFYFLLLYLLTYNTISIIFTLLDHYLPDGLGRYHHGFYYSRSIGNAIRDNISVIIVSIPMLYMTNRTLNSAMFAMKQSIPRIRLVLVYLTLFVGACAVLSSACCLVYYFLKGEVSIRFVIKILILSMTFVSFYFLYKGELKRDEEST